MAERFAEVLELADELVEEGRAHVEAPGLGRGDEAGEARFHQCTAEARDGLLAEACRAVPSPEVRRLWQSPVIPGTVCNVLDSRHKTTHRTRPHSGLQKG